MWLSPAASCQGIMGCHFGADLRRVDSLLPAMHNVVVDAVLDVQSLVGHAVEAPAVRVVFGEQQRWCPRAAQPARSK